MAARVLGHVRWTTRDALPVALVLAHGALLLSLPSIPLVAVGLWWNANTISHHFIHRPFFRTRALNAGFSLYLSLLLGFPHSLWRARHLAHHSGREGQRARHGSRLAPLDLVVVIALWAALLVFAPGFMLAVYLPGFLIGLGLCYLQGHYEHARGTVSHYGLLYNFLLLNDGYHVEHHARPGAHWRDLCRVREGEANASRWPAVLRWLECLNLCALERLVLRVPALQRYVIKRHERALRSLATRLPPVRRVGIVGGGLFPRTALILRQLLPHSRLVLIDMSADNLAVARRFLDGEVEFINKRFEPAVECEFDLLIIPLAFDGDRAAIYDRPPASAVLVHDWIWRRRGASVIVSWLLLKRLNLVTR
jgi:hypothetical protein